MEDGKIVVPGGVEYRVLVLPDHRVLSLAVLEKLEKLVQARRHLYWANKPESWSAWWEVRKRSKIWRIWPVKSGEKTCSKQENEKYGKGKVVWGMTAREYLLVKRDTGRF